MRESVFYSLIFMLYCICCDLHRAVSLQQCARDNSRLVRDFVQNELSSLYADYGVSIPYSCQLSSERDMYNDQENHLNEESPSRWTCEYCGKSFYALHYLDLHFDNRHADKIRQTSDVTCLADYCDILRCDVLGATKQPEYWTMALCKESRLVKLKHKCQDYLKSCIPDSLKGTEELDKFKDALHAKTCEFLTCERYWEIVRSSDTHNAKIPYIIAGIFMVFATILYYVAAYTHFYIETLFDSTYNGSADTRFSRVDHSASNTRQIRRRKM
ncbi:uncharacterized protein LOC141902600 isoform X2 [Tubulanus polymorphus]|uniref:uncharacterized protein LOC141902600 isoform X2 n=1 Tax=Tubulanus polymorphus TaxID=672921 RepID=UPI003DA23B3E